MFGLFGSARRRAAAHALDAVRPLVGGFQQAHGLPEGFWRNEFVIGFLGFMIGFFASHTSGRRLSESDKGLILVEVFGALSNLNGAEIVRDFTRLSMQSPKSESFERGADNAAICAFHSLGKLKRNEKTEDWLRKAEDIATASGQPNDHSAIGGALLHLLYTQPLEKEFGLFTSSTEGVEPNSVEFRAGRILDLLERSEAEAHRTLTWEVGNVVCSYVDRIGAKDIISLLSNLDQKDGLALAAEAESIADYWFNEATRTGLTDPKKVGAAFILVAVIFKYPLNLLSNDEYQHADILRVTSRARAIAFLGEAAVRKYRNEQT